MRYQLVFKYVVILLFFLSISFLIPAGYSLFTGDGLTEDFLFPLILMGALFLVALQIKEKVSDITIKEAILVVVLVWFLFPALSALVYIETGAIPHFADAYFESVSGFTTTGASVLTNVEAIPKSVLLWRSTTNWIGGVGFVVFSLSILPALGAGGAQLIRFESSKVIEEKILPKVKEIARAIVIVYVVLTLIETLLLKIFGMSLYDAVNHAFATLATGGFSTRNQSIAAYHSVAIEMTVTLFMFLGGSNLALYYRAFRKKSLKMFFSYYETKSSLILILSVTLFSAVVLYTERYYSSFLEALRYAVFQVVSCADTTGFASTDYTHWPTVVLALLMMVALIGGASGSTSGGIKQFRFIVMLKTMIGELKKTSHPRLIYRVSLGGRTLELTTLNAIWAFISIYFTTTFIFGLFIALSGYDLVTSFSASIACITSMGPGLAKVGPASNYAFLPYYDKLLLSLEMLLGRLEVFPILTLLLPTFWRD